MSNIVLSASILFLKRVGARTHKLAHVPADLSQFNSHLNFGTDRPTFRLIFVRRKQLK